MGKMFHVNTDTWSDPGKLKGTEAGAALWHGEQYDSSCEHVHSCVVCEWSQGVFFY